MGSETMWEKEVSEGLNGIVVAAFTRNSPRISGGMCFD